MSVKIFGYKPGSNSAKALADGLGARVLKHEGSRYRYKDGDTIVNWGSTNQDNPLLVNALNKPVVVQRASNKLTALQTLREFGVRVPDFWTRTEDIPDEAFPIVCRTVLSGHSGVGIVISNSRRELVAAPLYTRYVKKQDEYRIHVCRTRDGEQSIISVQRKALREGHPDPNFRVRNLANGFIYVRENVHPPVDVTNQAQAALLALDLDFGAVDVIWNARAGAAYVLEVNTAPGLEGATVEHYTNALRGLI